MIGDKIRAMREARGWTQEQLAELMGYSSKSTINKIEKNINDVNQKTMAKFAKAFGCDATEFIVSNNAVTEPGVAMIPNLPEHISNEDQALLDQYHKVSPETRNSIELLIEADLRKRGLQD